MTLFEISADSPLVCKGKAAEGAPLLSFSKGRSGGLPFEKMKSRAPFRPLLSIEKVKSGAHPTVPSL